MTTPAIVANAMLDGVYLDVDAEEWRVTPRDLKELVELADGSVREAWRHNGAARELKPRKYSFGISWVHLANMRKPIERLLSVPGVHRLILWREEPLSWVGNGTRVEFESPWRLAVDEGVTYPSGFLESRFAPLIRVGYAGADLTWVRKNQSDYDGASVASAGEVWWLDGGTTFKLPSAPAAGVYVFGHVVPAFRVLEDLPTEKRFTNPGAEPLVLNLREA